MRGRRYTFTMSGIRPLGIPAIPGLNYLHELNVRTYATLDGVPSVWFLSLDATQPIGVWDARTLFHLPCLHVQMHLTQMGDTLRAVAARIVGLRPAGASTIIGAACFLTERYFLYMVGADLLRGVHSLNLWRGYLLDAPARLEIDAAGKSRPTYAHGRTRALRC